MSISGVPPPGAVYSGRACSLLALIVPLSICVAAPLLICYWCAYHGLKQGLMDVFGCTTYDLQHCAAGAMLQGWFLTRFLSCVCARVLPLCNSPTECLLELVQTGVEMGCNLVMWWVMRNIMYQRPHIRDGIKGSLTSGDTVAAALLSMTLIVGVMTFATSRVSNTASMPMVIEMFAGIETIVTAVLVAVSAVLFIAGCRAASVPTQFVRVAVVRWPLPAVWWLADKGLLVVYLRGGSAGPRQHQSSGGNAPATTPGAELVPRRVPQH